MKKTAQVPVYRNPSASPASRVKDLLKRMTLEEKVLQMQNGAPALARLNIPAYDWWNEALHGVARAGNATVFPQAIGLAATWDTDLMHRIADVEDRVLAGADLVGGVPGRVAFDLDRLDGTWDQFGARCERHDLVADRRDQRRRVGQTELLTIRGTEAA